MPDNHILIVMRHAKAGQGPGPDFERTLRPRGQRDSAAAGRWLACRGYRPDQVVCSAARRTRQTWQHLAGELGGKPQFAAERPLYEADVQDLVEFIRQTSERVGTLLLIGHNPAAAGLAGMLTGTQPDFPTSAVAVIALDQEWARLAPGTGQLIASWAPRPAT